jgi:ADP-ribose pyrophosphatase YjhB (NUDIX family)
MIQHRIRAAAVVWNGSGYLLVVRHARRGERFWALPGGASKIGESLEETVRREVGEETGYAIDVGDVAAVFEVGSNRWEPRRLEVCLCGTIRRADPSLLVGGDGIVDVEWIDPQDKSKEFLPSALLSRLTPHSRGLYLGNITDIEHPVRK